MQITRIILSSRHNSKPTQWPELCQMGAKKHSFRVSTKRKPGMAISFWQDNPTVANSGAKRFEISKEYAEFWRKVQIPNTPIVKEMPLIAAIETFRMYWPNLEQPQFSFMIGSIMVDASMIEMIALNDGFENGQVFCTYFNAVAQLKGEKELIGQLVHWNSHTVYDAKTAKFFMRKRKRTSKRK